MTALDLAPWAIAALALLCVVVLLLRPDQTRRQLAELDQGLRREISTATRDGMTAAFEQTHRGNEAMQAVLGAFRTQVADTLEGFGRVQQVTLESVGRTLRDEQERLRAVMGEQLDAMRRTVGDTLQATVDKRMEESFRHVTEQFAAVQTAIGQVQGVAGQIGDLKRLFSNVRARGGWGEAHLEAMLQDCLPEGAYARNVQMREGSGERVEFALRMPNRDAETWLAVDAKFPTEDYDRLLLAAETGSRDDELTARRGLERAIREQASRIAKYIVPPRTVAFALMYLPTDGLFAEVARTPGLIEQVRRDHAVMVMGPSLLPPFLHTIRVGHATMTLERKASEIAAILAGIRGEWSAFGEAIQTIAKRADTLVTGIREVQTRGRAVERKLQGFDALAPAPSREE